MKNKSEKNKFIITVWSNPLSEDFILENIAKFNLSEILMWQSHISETLKSKLKLLNKLNI